MAVAIVLAAAAIVVGPAQNGATIHPAPGAVVVVRLPGNPTTGFRWTVARTPASLRLIRATYVPMAPKRLGSGGTFVFRYAARPGSGVLRILYRRAWEGAAPAKTFTLHVNV